MNKPALTPPEIPLADRLQDHATPTDAPGELTFRLASPTLPLLLGAAIGSFEVIGSIAYHLIRIGPLVPEMRSLALSQASPGVVLALLAVLSRWIWGQNRRRELLMLVAIAAAALLTSGALRAYQIVSDLSFYSPDSLLRLTGYVARNTVHTFTLGILFWVTMSLCREPPSKTAGQSDAGPGPLNGKAEP